MKKHLFIIMIGFLVGSVFLIGCEGNDDGRDDDHDSRISSMSSKVLALTGANLADNNCPVGTKVEYAVTKDNDKTMTMKCVPIADEDE